MKFTQCTSAACLLAATASAAPAPEDRKPLVSPLLLEDSIKANALLQKSQRLERFAYSTEARNRLAGSEGHNKTVDYIYKTLSETGYYNVEKQTFDLFVSESVEAKFAVKGKPVKATAPFEFSPNGTITAPLSVVANEGCEPGDYGADVDGTIALISRGTCEFGLKSAYAGAAGAVGAVIYNNVEGNFTGGTLGTPNRPEGAYVPTVGVTQTKGLQLVEQAGNGKVQASIDVLSFFFQAFATNVIAETKGGDHGNVLAMGAHTDSVAAGPGINDDGSGTVGILETALQLTKYKTLNAVRFGFWAGEEEGLLGSTFYVESLTKKELARIRLYLNYDMIASPNYVYAIYDGDGSSFNQSGPAGSDKVEAFYEQWFAKNGYNFTATAFDGRSDYGPFLEADIPCGGLFTGAEEIKTEEDVEKFGGVAGVAYDENYHAAGDNVANLNVPAFVVNTRLIAYTTGFYAKSFKQLGNSGLNARDAATPASTKEYIRTEGRKRLSRRTGLPLSENI